MDSRLVLLVVVTAALASGGAAAKAAVESFTFDETGPLAVGAVREVHLPQFNPSLGALQSVILDLRGVVVLAQGFAHPAGGHRQLSVQQNFDLVLDLADNQRLITLGLTQPSLGAGSGSSHFESNSANGGFERAFLAGRETVSAPNELLKFTGCGFVDLFLTSQGGLRDWAALRNGLAGVWSVGENITVTYAYTPVPETGAWMAGASVLASMILLNNRRSGAARGSSRRAPVYSARRSAFRFPRPLWGLLMMMTVMGSARAAVELEGTLGFTPIGEISYSGTDLGHASSVALPSTEVVNTVPATYAGNPNDFYSGANAVPLLSQVTINPLMLLLPSAWGSFSAVSYPDFLVLSSSTTPLDRYDFNLSGLMKTSSGPADLEIYGTGILHDSQGRFADTPALLSFAFTQAGPSGVVNASFSVASTVIPEPATGAAGCFALGLLALGSVFWARK